MNNNRLQLLNQDSKEKIKAIENNLYNIPLIRNNLEKVITQQINTLSSGLFAFLFLNKNDNNIIFQLFQFKNKYKDVEVGKFLSYQQEIQKKILTGEIKPINPNSLTNIEISIFQKQSFLWDYNTINKQLETVGSDLRLVVQGDLSFLENALKSFVDGLEHSEINAGYILGEVECVTCSPFGRIFDFKFEHSISPFIDCSAPAFTFDDNIVIRQEILKRNLKSEDISMAKIHALIHECYHVLGSENNKKECNFYNLHYKNELQNDILRYTRSPKSNSEILESFDTYLISLMIKNMEELGIDLKKKPTNIQALITSMIDEEKLFLNSNKMIFSKQYNESRLWMSNW